MSRCVGAVAGARVSEDVSTLVGCGCLIVLAFAAAIGFGIGQAIGMGLVR